MKVRRYYRTVTIRPGRLGAGRLGAADYAPEVNKNFFQKKFFCQKVFFQEKNVFKKQVFFQKKLFFPKKSFFSKKPFFFL